MFLDHGSSFPIEVDFGDDLRLYFINPMGMNSLSMKSKEILVKSRKVVADFLGCSLSKGFCMVKKVV